MSLDWNLTRIKDCDTVCFNEDREMSPTVHALIWATMAVDLGEISDENYVEFYLRIKLYEQMFSAMRYTEPAGEPAYFTFEEVQLHIGLRTNVSDKTWGQWLKRMGTNWRAVEEHRISQKANTLTEV
jgi:hypothetical protein